MARRHSVRNGAGTAQRMPMPVQGDDECEIRNGYPVSPYLPRDPGRRRRLLKALRNNEQQEDVTTSEQEEGNHAN